jgi:hypothetical protein
LLRLRAARLDRTGDGARGRDRRRRRTPCLAGGRRYAERLPSPGAVADTKATIVCAYGYARTHRNVPYTERDAVYNEYVKSPF